jgi:hypothetical protein
LELVDRRGTSRAGVITYVEVVPDKDAELVLIVGLNLEKRALNLVPANVLDILHQVEGVLDDTLGDGHRTVLGCIELAPRLICLAAFMHGLIQRRAPFATSY